MNEEAIEVPSVFVRWFKGYCTVPQPYILPTLYSPFVSHLSGINSLSWDKCIGRDELICRSPPQTHFISEEALDFQLLSFAVFKLLGLQYTIPCSKWHCFQQYKTFLSFTLLSEIEISYHVYSSMCASYCRRNAEAPMQHSSTSFTYCRAKPPSPLITHIKLNTSVNPAAPLFLKQLSYLGW